jgi:membrane protease subunit HflK
MKEIYSNVTKVMVESRQGSNMLYLPLDKIMQMNGVNPATAGAVNEAMTTETQPAISPNPPISDSRGRDNRQRDRDSR